MEGGGKEKRRLRLRIPFIPQIMEMGKERIHDEIL